MHAFHRVLLLCAAPTDAGEVRLGRNDVRITGQTAWARAKENPVDPVGGIFCGVDVGDDRFSGNADFGKSELAGDDSKPGVSVEFQVWMKHELY